MPPLDRTALIEALAAITGPRFVLTDPQDMAPYLSDWRGAYGGAALCVVRPADTAQVSALLRLCSDHGIGIVPQGGNTGLCGGAVPDASATQVVVSLGRMNAVRAIDPANNTLVAEAGCILARIQDEAARHHRLFPLSLGAEGSCTIGGNLATNAGGVAVLRYGTMRDLVLGLEVVLPDGRVLDGLRALRKDNTGYDLKHLFIGSEGSLGIITAAVLKLFPAPLSKAVAWIAVPSPDAAIAVFNHLNARTGGRLTGFELMSRPSLEMVLDSLPGCTDPLAHIAPWYVLAEITDSAPDAGLDAVLEDALISPFEDGLAQDAVLAASQAQALALWKLREGISEAQGHYGHSLKHDIAVAVSDIPRFIAEARAALLSVLPNLRIVCYGHVGDGNLHFNLTRPADWTDAQFRAQAETLSGIVYDLTARFNGSISAEHGLGQSKRGVIARYKSAAELDVMRTIKSVLDPKGIMNPGKVLP